MDVLKPDTELSLQKDRKVPNITPATQSPSASIVEANVPPEPPVSPVDESNPLEATFTPPDTPEPVTDRSGRDVDNAESPNPFNPGFPIPVNIRYQDYEQGMDETTVPEILQSAQQQAEQTVQAGQDQWLQKINETLSKPNSLPSSQFWYPEGYFDMKKQVEDTDDWFRDYATGKYADGGMGDLSMNAGASGNSWTTTQQNAVERNFPAVSRFTKNLLETPLQIFGEGNEVNVGEALKYLIPGYGFVKGFQLWTNPQELGKRATNLLQNLAPVTDKEGNAYFDPAHGYFGDFGKAGAGSAALYLLNLPQNLLMSGIYAVGDAIKGNKVDPRSRVLDSIKGTDYGFMNYRSQKKYLSVVDEKTPQPIQWGAGFVLDLLTGGIADKLVGLATGAGKLAKKTAEQTAAQAPDFTKGVSAASKVTPPEPPKPITTIRLKKEVDKALKTVASEAPSVEKLADANMAAERLRKLMQRATPEQAAEVVRDKILPKELQGISQASLERTQQLIVLDEQFTKKASDAQRKYQILKRAAKSVADDLDELDQLPNVERAPLPSQEMTKEFLNTEPPTIGRLPKRIQDILDKQTPQEGMDDLLGQASEVLGKMDEEITNLQKGLDEDLSDISKLPSKDSGLIDEDYLRVMKRTPEEFQQELQDKVKQPVVDINVGRPGLEADKVLEEAFPGQGAARHLGKQGDGGVVPLRQTFYHGSKLNVDPELFHMIRPRDGSAFNELGAGLYVIDDPEIAAKYAQAHPQLNKPVVPGQWDEVGNVYEVSVGKLNTLDASKSPDSLVRRIFIESADEVGLDHDTLMTYRGKLANAPLERFWTDFRELYADKHPGEFIPEDLMIEFQRRVAQKLYDSGYEAIEKQTTDGKRILNILQPTEGELPINTLSKVPVGTGNLLEQKAARFETDQWAESVFGSTTHHAYTVQSKASLGTEIAENAEEAYRLAEEEAMDAAESLTRVENDLADLTEQDYRTLARQEYANNVDKPAQELSKYVKETDSPCL